MLQWHAELRHGMTGHPVQTLAPATAACHGPGFNYLDIDHLSMCLEQPAQVVADVVLPRHVACVGAGGGGICSVYQPMCVSDS